MCKESTLFSSDVDRTFTILFDLTDGKSPSQLSAKRYLADVKKMFVDEAAAERILAKKSPGV